jgi:endo-1,4-beta-xylanase
MNKVVILSVLLSMVVSLFSAWLVPQSASAATLRQVAEARGFLIGSAGSYWRFTSDASYQNLLANEFNSVTPENEMKWVATEPTQGTFTFYAADQMVKYAQSKGMRIHGHTLVWSQGLPAWLQNGTFTRDQLIAILKTHIQTVVSRYKGKVQEWDVVNEAIEHKGNGLRDNVFLRVIGPEYIAMSFQFAHDADPAAILYYNDYATDIWPIKSATQFTLLSGLIASGVPVNAVGLQMHQYTDTAIPTAQYANELSLLGSLGLRVGITEFDSSGLQPASKTPDVRVATQAQNYTNALTACLSVTACKSFTTWGVADPFSFQPNYIPLMRDAAMNPKPAYTSVLNTLLTF